jgi:hypothetical protein
MPRRLITATTEHLGPVGRADRRARGATPAVEHQFVTRPEPSRSRRLAWPSKQRAAAQRAARQAQIWTAHELSMLSIGWHVVHHVALERAEVDHVLCGPGGFFAIETEFRSDWEQARDDLAALATRARRAAHSLQGHMGLGRRVVDAVVVMWGAGAGQVAERQPEIDGVTMLAGTQLAAWIRTRPVSAGSGVVDQALSRLHDHLARRDELERAELANPR